MGQILFDGFYTNRYAVFDTLILATVETVYLNWVYGGCDKLTGDAYSF
jgi:hypothetical protein